MRMSVVGDFTLLVLFGRGRPTRFAHTIRSIPVAGLCYAMLAFEVAPATGLTRLGLIFLILGPNGPKLVVYI